MMQASVQIDQHVGTPRGLQPAYLTQSLFETRYFRSPVKRLTTTSQGSTAEPLPLLSLGIPRSVSCAIPVSLSQHTGLLSSASCTDCPRSSALITLLREDTGATACFTFCLYSRL